MPTWRKGLEIKFSFFKSEYIFGYQNLLANQNAILIEKQHPQVMEELGIEAKRKGYIYSLSSREAANVIDTQELLLVCDRLITDYSSCNVDYMTLYRPQIYFMYDYDFYVKERGLIDSIESVVAGPIAKNEHELLYYLGLNDEDVYHLKGAYWRDLFESEKGHACEQFAQWVGLAFESK